MTFSYDKVLEMKDRLVVVTVRDKGEEMSQKQEEPWPGGWDGRSIILYTKRWWIDSQSGHKQETTNSVSLSQWCFFFFLSLKTYPQVRVWGGGATGKALMVMVDTGTWICDETTDIGHKWKWSNMIWLRGYIPVHIMVVTLYKMFCKILPLEDTGQSRQGSFCIISYNYVNLQ